MSFRIDIDGLDDLKRELEQMQKGLTLPVINQWCQKIESEAKLSCPDEFKDSIRIYAVPVGSNQFDIKVGAVKESLPYVKQAIESNIKSMPITTKQLFETLLENIKQKMEETS